MKTTNPFLECGLMAALVAATFSTRAQVQTTGTPGSPSATTTLSGKQLPSPDPKG